MMSDLISRKEFIRLVQQLHNYGLSYNEVARQIDLPSPILYNIRKGKPASFTALHVAALRALIKQYEQDDAQALRAVNAYEELMRKEKRIKELEQRMKALEEENAVFSEFIKGKFAKEYRKFVERIKGKNKNQMPVNNEDESSN